MDRAERRWRRMREEPAALLTESLAEAGDDDCGGLGVDLADLVPAVVALRRREIGGAGVRLAERHRRRGYLLATAYLFSRSNANCRRRRRSPAVRGSLLSGCRKQRPSSLHGGRREQRGKQCGC